jgi:hypothetical protein
VVLPFPPRFCARESLKSAVCAQTAALKLKDCEFMKTTLIIALAAMVAGGILWLAPNRLSAADTTSAGQKILSYTCPMHPSVKSDKPGDCPICGMHLAPVYANSNGDGTNAAPAVTNTNTSLMTRPGCCGSGGCR